MGKKLKLPDLTESQIEMQIGHYLRIKGHFFWKSPTAGYFDVARGRFRKQTNPYAINGAPDLMLIIEGKFIGIEVKKRLGKQSPEQILFQQRLEKAGGKYFVARSVEDVEQALESLAS